MRKPDGMARANIRSQYEKGLADFQRFCIVRVAPKYKLNFQRKSDFWIS